MADYTPPTENLPIFDKVVFLTGDEFITTSQADKRYLRYPNAQGTENLQAINVNGVLTANSTTNLNGNVSIPNNDIFVRNIRIGYGNENRSSNVVLGIQSGLNNTTGEFNTFLGSNSGTFNTTGARNVFVGSYAGRFNTSGSFNTCVGQDAGNNNISGSRNTFIGRSAGIGCLGSDNICLGQDTDCSGNLNNSIAIGSGVKATASNTILIGASTQSVRLSTYMLINSDLNTTYKRIYQELNPSWSNVNGFYEMAKDVYPTLNPLSSGVYSVGTWTTRTNPVNNQWYSVCWSPQLKLFACVAGSGGTDRIMTSPDGITWTTRTSPSPNSIYNTIIWVQELSLFIAVGGNIGTYNITTSPDGITWTHRTTPNNIFTSVCWSPELSLLVAVARSGTNDRVATSPDGITWTSRISPADNSWNGVCWSAELGLFVAVAYSGTGNRIMTSPDGINWTIRSSPADNQWQRVCWSPELGLFVAIAITGNNNRVMTSSNGINWTTRTTNTNNWRDICWSPELKLFVAISDSGTSDRIMTSPNGINWTTRTTNNNDWWGICWSPELGIFVGCGINGTNTRIMTSSLKGRPPTSSNVFDSSSNSISETGIWNLTANTINTDALSIKQIGSGLNTLEIAFDGSTSSYIRAIPNGTGTSTMFLNTYSSGIESDVMSLNNSRIQIRRPIQFSYLTTPSTSSQLGFLTSANLTTSTGLSTQTDPTSAGSVTLSAGTWQIIVLFEFKGSGNHNLTTFEYAISNSSTAFPTTAPYTVAYMYEPTTTLKTTKISKQLSLTLQLTSSVVIYFLERLSWTGGGTVDISGFYTYTRIG